jgi:hypothetical protein
MRIIVILMSFFAAACNASPAPVQKTTASSLITREQAIADAIRIASGSAPEISGALVPPQNLRADQLTLTQAMQRMTGEVQIPNGYEPATPVWYVTMDGLWANEVQAPGVTTTQVPYHHYFVVLDAVTGLEIESSLRP